MDQKTFGDAVLNNDIQAVTRGLEEHPDFINTEFQARGNTTHAIHVAAMRGYTELASLFADHGANINEVVTVTEGQGEDAESHQRTPLALAYGSRNLNTAIALIKKGARCYATDDHAREITAFKSAAVNTYGEVDRVYRLLQIGVPETIITSMRNRRDKLDSFLQAIAERGGKLSKRVPKATPSNGNILNDDFLAFAEVLSLAYRVRSGVENKTTSKNFNWMIPDFLDRTKGNWPEIASNLRAFSPQDAEDFKDAVKAFTEVIVLPEFTRKSKNLVLAGKVDIQEVVRELIPVVTDAIIADRGLSVVLDLSKDWHQDQPALEAAIRQPEFARKGEWLPLTRDYHASNGLTISFVTSAQALDELGRDQKHCVSGYASKCMQEPAHIGVVKDGDNVLSTFEVQEEPKDKKIITIPQHRRANNAAVPAHAPETEALKEFIGAVRSRKVKIDFRALSAGREKIEQEANDVRYICGFDPFKDDDGKNETNALHQYVKVRTGGREDSIVKGSNSFVSGGEHKWGKTSAKDFLEQTGIMKKIDEIAANPPAPMVDDDDPMQYMGRR